METNLKKHRELTEKKEKQLKELYILSGIIHAYRFPVPEHKLELTLEELQTRLLAGEQLLRITNRELELAERKINYIGKHN